MQTIVEMPSKGCARLQRVRPSRVVVCDGYLCGGTYCQQNPPFASRRYWKDVSAVSPPMQQERSADTTPASLLLNR
jgi:hypothetical protein